MAAVWRSGLGAYFSRRATGELRRALKTLDASFEVKEAVVDFGVRPPHIKAVSYTHLTLPTKA